MAIAKLKKFKITTAPDLGKVNTLKVGDIVMRQYFDSKNLISSTMYVHETGTEIHTVDGKEKPSHYFIGSLLYGDEPKAGELLDFVRLTSLLSPDREGALYLTANDDGAPFMDIVSGFVSEHSVFYPNHIGTNGYEPLNKSTDIQFIKNKQDRFRIGKLVHNGVAGFIGMQHTGDMSNTGVWLVSFKAIANKNTKAVLSIDSDMNQEISLSKEIKEFFFPVTTENLGNIKRSIKLECKELVLKDDWVELSDFSIVQLSDILSLNNATKLRAGKLSGIVDENFGSLSDYGVYTQSFYATKNINIAGTLIAGDKGGVGASFYAGKIHKNAFVNSLGIAFTSEKPVQSDKRSIFGVGNVYKLGESPVSLFAQSLEWKSKNSNKEYCFSVYVLCDKKTELTIKSSNGDSYTQTITDTSNWTRVFYSTFIKENKQELTFELSGNGLYFTAPQLEVGDSPTLYQPTDHTLNYTDEYGAWLNRGGLGGTIQNPLLSLNPDGSIESIGSGWKINPDGTGHLAGGALTFTDKKVNISFENSNVGSDMSEAIKKVDDRLTTEVSRLETNFEIKEGQISSSVSKVENLHKDVVDKYGEIVTLGESVQQSETNVTQTAQEIAQKASEVEITYGKVTEETKKSQENAQLAQDKADLAKIEAENAKKSAGESSQSYLNAKEKAELAQEEADRAKEEADKIKLIGADVTEYHTEIIQTAKEVSQKATEVQTNADKITTQETAINQTAEKITTQASQVEVNAGKVQENTTLVEQTAEEISLTAENVAGDKLIVTQTAKEIEQIATDINGKQTEINQTADKIVLTAKDVQLNANKAKEQAGIATSKADEANKSALDAQGALASVTEKETAITQTAEKIETTATKVEKDAGIASEASVKAQNDAIKANEEATKANNKALEATKKAEEALASAGASSQSYKDAKAEADKAIQEALTATEKAKEANQSALDAQDALENVTKKETSINQTAEKISSQAVEVQKNTEDVILKHTEINQTAEKISLQAEDVDSNKTIVEQLADKVSSTAIDVEGMQTEIIQTSEKVASDAENVRKNKTSIEQTANRVSSDAKNVAGYKTSIEQTADEVSLNAQKALDSAGRAVEAEASINLKADGIVLEASDLASKKAIDNLKIGSRNLFLNSDFVVHDKGFNPFNHSGWRFDVKDSLDCVYISGDTSDVLSAYGLAYGLAYRAGNFNITAISKEALSQRILDKDIVSYQSMVYVEEATRVCFSINDNDVVWYDVPANEWTLLSHENHTVDFGNLDGNLFWCTENNKPFYITRVQLELGNKCTGWNRAPEDDIRDYKTSKATFEVTSDKIQSNVESIERVDDKVEKNSSEILQQADKIQSTVKKVEELDGTVKEHSTSISQNSKTISLVASDIENIDERIKKAEISLEPDNIWLAVEDKTKDSVKSGISISANKLTIFGEDISMSGAVTFESFDSQTSNDFQNFAQFLYRDIGDLAYESTVEFDALGTTIIDGNYIKTGLINADAIITSELIAKKLVGNEFVGKNAIFDKGTIGGWQIMPSMLLSASGRLVLDPSGGIKAVKDGVNNWELNSDGTCGLGKKFIIEYTLPTSNPKDPVKNVIEDVNPIRVTSKGNTFIGGFRVGTTSIRNEVVEGSPFENDASIVMRKDHINAFAAIGTNVLPLSMGDTATLKLENKEKRDGSGLINYGAIIDVNNAQSDDNNIAIDIRGGCIKGLSLRTTKVLNGNLSINPLDYSFYIFSANFNATLTLDCRNVYIPNGYVIIVSSVWNDYSISILGGRVHDQSGSWGTKTEGSRKGCCMLVKAFDDSNGVNWKSFRSMW